MFSGALFIQLALKWNMYLSLAVLLVVTGIYTILGIQFHTVLVIIVFVFLTDTCHPSKYENLEIKNVK